MQSIKKGILMFFTLSLITTMILTGCSNTATKSETDPTTTEAKVDMALVEKGEKIAKTTCIGCHGRDLTGDMGPNLHNLTITDDQILEVLRKGSGPMPASTANGFEQEVLAYLKSLK